MSFRLLGIAHRKKRAVTRKKGSMRPAGTNGTAMPFLLFCDGRGSEPMDPTGIFKVELPSSEIECDQVAEDR